jgi:hypothetical protein
MPTKPKPKGFSRKKKSANNHHPKQKQKLQNNNGTASESNSTSKSNSSTSSTSTRHRIISASSLVILLVAYIWKWSTDTNTIENQTLFQILVSKLFEKSSDKIYSSTTNSQNSQNNQNVTDSQEVKIQNFLSWLHKNGAIISPSVTIASFPEFGGFGLQAKQKITNNEADVISSTATSTTAASSSANVLQALDDSRSDNIDQEYAIKYLDEMFTIPESIIISSTSILHQFSKAESHIQIPQFQHRITQLVSKYVPSNYMVQQDVIIALYLMVQCSLGEYSAFKPYLDILPSYIIPRLDTFNKEELHMLQDEELAFLAKESRDRLHHLWESNELQYLLSSMIEVVAQDIDYVNTNDENDNDNDNDNNNGKKSNHHGECISFNSFHKYNAIVSSRAMVLKGTKYLTPLPEFANYQPRQDERKKLKGKMKQTFMLYHERNDKSGSITVRADRNVLHGDQIFEDYGDIDNSLYLEAHGFVPNDNPFHCAMIPASLVPTPKDLPGVLRNAMIALRLLPNEKSELYPPPMICILDDGSVTENRAEAYLKIAAIMGIGEGHDDLISQCAEALDSNDEELIQLQCLHYVGHQQLLKNLIRGLSQKTICQSESTLAYDLNLLDSLLDEEKKINSAGTKGEDLTKKILALKFRISDKVILDKVTGGVKNVNCSQIDDVDSPKNNDIEKCPIHYEANDVAIHAPSKEDSAISLLEKFNKFIESLDMPIQKVEATFVGEGMRIGVVAKENIDEGQVYLSINSSSVIDADTVKLEKEASKMNTILDTYKESSRDGGFDILLLYLIHEKFISKEKSRWYPYIDLLPTIDEMKQSSPLFFDDKLYDYAAGSDLRISLIHNKRKAEDSFVTMSSNKDILSVLGPDVMQRDYFFWAYNIINSR